MKKVNSIKMLVMKLCIILALLSTLGYVLVEAKAESTSVEQRNAKQTVSEGDYQGEFSTRELFPIGKTIPATSKLDGTSRMENPDKVAISDVNTEESNVPTQVIYVRDGEFEPETCITYIVLISATIIVFAFTVLTIIKNRLEVKEFLANGEENGNN